MEQQGKGADLLEPWSRRGGGGEGEMRWGCKTFGYQNGRRYCACIREDGTGRLLGRHGRGIGHDDWTRNVSYHFVEAAGINTAELCYLCDHISKGQKGWRSTEHPMLGPAGPGAQPGPDRGRAREL